MNRRVPNLGPRPESLQRSLAWESSNRSDSTRSQLHSQRRSEQIRKKP